MKSTTLNSFAPANYSQADINSDKARALPFFILMSTAGLPLNYKLEMARPMTVADSAELSLAATASQNTGNSVLFVAFICGLYLWAGWTFVRKPKVVATLLSRQWPVFLLMLFILLSTLWSHTADKVLINSVHNIGIMLIAISAALRYRSDPWSFPKHLGYVVGINLLFHLAAIILIPSYAIDWQGRWHGLSPHPNTLGAIAFVVFWCNAAVLIFRNNDRYHLHLAFVLLAMVMMIGANSMTSIMSTAITFLIMLSIKSTLHFDRRHLLYLTTLTLCLAVSIAALFLTDILKLDMLFNLIGRDSNLTGRVSLWESALKAISENFLAGWSFDDNTHLIRVSNMPYLTFHNGYLDLAVSGGLIALILFFLILLTTLKDYLSSSRVGNVILPVSLSFVITYIINNFTESTLVSPRSQMWIIFITLVFLGSCRYRSASTISKISIKNFA